MSQHPRGVMSFHLRSGFKLFLPTRRELMIRNAIAVETLLRGSERLRSSAARRKNPFLPCRNNSVMTLGRWLRGSASSDTISTEEYDLRSAVSLKLIDNTQRTGRLSPTVGRHTSLSLRDRVVHALAPHPTRPRRDRVKCRSRRYNSITRVSHPLSRSAIAFPAPRRVSQHLFSPLRSSPTRTSLRFPLALIARRRARARIARRKKVIFDRKVYNTLLCYEK